MFTGIVEERGAVAAADGSRLLVACRTVAGGAAIGDSIAVNGVCLTVVEHASGRLAFDLSEETLARSSLGRLAPGDPVNLERPVTLSARLGGHLVQGHVDGIGTIASIEPDAEGGARLRIDLPGDLDRYVVEKGSITVDGVSLTVAARASGWIEVALIPHTLAVTTFAAARAGQPVNLEVDVIAKYVERLMEGMDR